MCADGSSTISVPYTVTSGSASGSYSVLLSDASGSFASATTLTTSSTSSPLVVTIPKTVAGGTGYLVKAVVGGNAASANATAFTINNVSIAPTANQSVTINTNGTALTATEAGGTATARQWYYSTTSGSGYTNAIGGATGTSYTPNFPAAGTYYVVVQTVFPSSSGTCTATSNEVAVTVTNPTITTGTLSSTTYCAVGNPASISVPFTTSASFAAGTTFSVQLSSSSGSFSSGTTIIGTGTTSPIVASIPAGTNGSNYYVRVISTSPAVNSTNSRNITVYGTLAVNISPTSAQTISKNAGTGTALAVSETPSADVASRQWAYGTTSGGPYTDISGQTAATYTPKAADFGGTTGTYYVVEKSTFTTCGTTVTSSNEAVITVVDTRLVVNPTSLSGFVTPAGTASDPQTYTLQGYDLLGNVTLTIPTNFEAGYSTTSAAPGSYSAGTGSLTIARADALAGVTVYVRLRSAATAGTYGGSINNTATGAVAQSVAVSGTVTGLTVSATSLTAFNTLVGAPSSPRTFTVAGSYLPGAVTVAAPAGYEIATATAGPYGSSLTLTPDAANNNSVSATVYVRLTGATAGTFSGNVVVSSPNASTRSVAVSGTVVGKPTGTPAITAGTPALTSVTLTLGAADGTNLLVVVRPASSPAITPTDQTPYTANTTYGSGTALGGGYVVFAATNAGSVTVTGLLASTSYTADIYTYNLGTTSGFESYGLNSGTTAFTTATPPTYTWNGTGTSWSAASSWTPARTTPASTDRLVFDGATTPSTTLAADFTTGQTVGQLALRNNADVTLNTTANRTLNISNGVAGADFSVEAGSELTLYNSSTSSNVGLTLALGTGATATVAGGLSFDGGTSSGTHQLLGSGASSVTFASGGYFYQTIDYTGYPFGSTSTYQNNVLFSNGSTLYHQGGSQPFGNFAPNSVIVLQPASTYFYWVPGTTPPPLANRTYGNLVFDVNTNTNSYTVTSTASSPLTIAGNLTVTTGTINLNLGATISVAGNVSVASGATLGFAPSSLQTVLLNGTSQQVITSGGTLTFGANSTLQLNNPAGARLASPLSLSRLTLTNGLLTTDATNLLTLGATAVLNGGSSSSYVSGPVARPVPTTSNAAGTYTAYQFPVGKAGAYRPLTLNVNTQGNAVTYVAEQLEGNPGQAGTDPTANDGTTLTRVSRVRSFNLTPYVGATVTQPTGFQGTVTLSFDADDQVSSLSRLVVAKRPDSSQPWANISTLGGTSSGSGFLVGTLTSGSFSSFSDFALASTDPDRNNSPLPVQLTAFAATRAADKDVALTWTTASEVNSAYFEVERSLDGHAFAPVARVRAAGSSAQAHAYTSRDADAPASLLYYRLRQVDQDGKVAYSPAVAVAAGPAGELTLTPNPTHDQLRLLTGQPTAYTVRNTLGQVVLTGTTAAGSFTTLTVAGLPGGVYFFELHGTAGRVVRKFVKE